MVALATTSIAWILFAVITVGWLVYLVLNIGSARPEVGSEIELAPNRKAVLRRRDARRTAPRAGAAARSAAAGRHRHRSPAVLGARAESPGRRRRGPGRGVRRVGCELLRDHRQRRVQLRRLPRRHERHRGCCRLRPHRSEDRRGHRRCSGRLRRSTPSTTGSARRRSASSSSTAVRSRRCKRGAPTAADR